MMFIKSFLFHFLRPARDNIEYHVKCAVFSHRHCSGIRFPSPGVFPPSGCDCGPQRVDLRRRCCSRVVCDGTALLFPRRKEESTLDFCFASGGHGSFHLWTINNRWRIVSAWKFLDGDGARITRITATPVVPGATGHHYELEFH